MPEVYISIGSNVQREKHIRAAISALQHQYNNLLISPIYESAAVGFHGDPFYNLVVGFTTEQLLPELLQTLRSIEAANGRVRSVAIPKLSARTLDLDVLLYGDETGKHAGITLPRAEIVEQDFVLLPLTNIAGQKKHPLLDKTYQALWQEYQAGHDRLLKPVAL